jgi:hypothetical protein
LSAQARRRRHVLPNFEAEGGIFVALEVQEDVPRARRVLDAEDFENDLVRNRLLCSDLGVRLHGRLGHVDFERIADDPLGRTESRHFHHAHADRM